MFPFLSAWFPVSVVPAAPVASVAPEQHASIRCTALGRDHNKNYFPVYTVDPLKLFVLLREIMLRFLPIIPYLSVPCFTVYFNVYDTIPNNAIGKTKCTGKIVNIG